MDTITFRLPYRRHHTIRLNKSTLAKILIVAELIGIAILAWHLRYPLYKKYLAIKPKSYSITAFEPLKRYLLSENDFIVGKAPPDSKIKLIFNPGRYKRTVRVSDKGNWVAQLPKSLDEKRYRLTIAHFDTSDQLSSVSSFKVRVRSENVFVHSPFYRYLVEPFVPRNAQAQEVDFSTTPEYKTWVNELQKLGLYPYCESNTEPTSFCTEDSVIVVTNYTGYANVCSRLLNCYKSESSTQQLSTLIDPTIANTLSAGHSLPYIRPISDLLDSLVTPPIKVASRAEDLENTPFDALSEEERVLLLQKDGKQTPYVPYVEEALTQILDE